MSWFITGSDNALWLFPECMNLLKYNNQAKINKPYWLPTVTASRLLGRKEGLFGLITGAVNMMHSSDICLGMLFKTCKVRTVRRRDNPASDALTVAAPSFLHVPLHLCVAHLFTSLPGRRAAAAAEWNDNEDGLRVASLSPRYTHSHSYTYSLPLLTTIPSPPPTQPPPFLSKSVQTLLL